MAILVGSGKRLTTDDGIPYMWQSGDVTTAPSNENKIVASDGAQYDDFGSSVAVGSGKIVVGAEFDNTSGSAYIFDLNGNQLGIITASDIAASDNFGQSVAVGCGRIVVGARFDDDNGNASGSAYIYDLDGTNEIKIPVSDGAAGDWFGNSVAVGCGKIVVGAPLDDDNGAIESGSAYIYDLDGNNEVKITASDATFSDEFGYSVAVGSGKIVVGARGDNSDQGAAYIYNLDGTNEVKITASDGAANDEFGYSVAVGSGRIVVGSPYKAMGLNDDQGAAYIYDLDGNQLGIITASDGAVDEDHDEFGYSVAVGSGRIVVGARSGYDSGTNPGLAYVYDLDGNNEVRMVASDAASSTFDQFGYSVAVGSGRIVVGAPSDDIGSNSSQGAAYIYDTPPVYNLYDAIDLNYG